MSENAISCITARACQLASFILRGLYVRLYISLALVVLIGLSACSSGATPQPRPENVTVVSRDAAVDVAWQAPANGAGIAGFRLTSGRSRCLLTRPRPTCPGCRLKLWSTVTRSP